MSPEHRPPCACRLRTLAAPCGAPATTSRTVGGIAAELCEACAAELALEERRQRTGERRPS